MTSKFEVFKDDTGLHWRWRLKARNGEIVAQSEAYATKQSAVRGAHDAAAAANEAGQVEVEVLQ